MQLGLCRSRPDIQGTGSRERKENTRQRIGKKAMILLPPRTTPPFFHPLPWRAALQVSPTFFSLQAS